MIASRVPFIGLFCLLLAASGCRGLSWPRVPFQETAPVVFTGPPTASDIVRIVNSNSAPIRQLHADGATISVAGFPPLYTNLEFERPRRFRMRAQGIGPELDLGSNDELFWFWVKRNAQPAVYFARHEQFAHSPTKQVIPIDPLWLPEAMGVVQLDPMIKYEGPFPAGPHRVQIRTRVATPQGDQTRAYVMHDQYGWLLEQHVYDARGQLLASARASKHQHYKGEGVTLPQHVEIQVPSQQLNLTLNVSGYQINHMVGDATQLWTLPKFDGYPLVDLADPNLRMTPNGFVSIPPNTAPAATFPVNGAPPTYPTTNPATMPYTAPQSNYRLNQRGMPTTQR